MSASGESLAEYPKVCLGARLCLFRRRPEKLERQDALRGMPEGEPEQPLHLGREGNHGAAAGRRAEGGSLRGDLDTEMVDGGGGGEGEKAQY